MSFPLVGNPSQKDFGQAGVTIECSYNRVLHSKHTEGEMIMFLTSDISDIWTVARNPLISALRGLNTALDITFYDVEALSREERELLAGYSKAEDSMVIVYPGGSGKEITFMSPLDFVFGQENNIADPAEAIVVTGVGSSALGTAALARNVADYLGGPAAGIVSGMGMADMITEALGGWAFLGIKDTIRNALARVLHAMEIKDQVRDEAFHEDIRRHFSLTGINAARFVYGSPDATTLLYVLTKLRTRIKLLVGHSKGNYSIENALEGWDSASAVSRTDIPEDLMIITLGAAIWLPENFRNVYQFIGQFDPLGIWNSRPYTACVSVPFAQHSLNRSVPGCIDVAEALRSAGVR